ncbi:MAG: hypothetical protein ACRDRG_13690, partial [Pseudonocardiaceae bacterium]
RILLRADAGYFAGQLARAALASGVEFAIGARRIAALWRIRDGLGATRSSCPTSMSPPARCLHRRKSGRCRALVPTPHRDRERLS